MPNDYTPNIDFPRTMPADARPHPNPPEDISEHGRQGEPIVYGPDGSGETPETDDESQPARGAD
jgi:hypothetical protein